MYYFYDEETYQIVKRKHQYNSEALDGLITHIEPDDKAFLLVHIPNRSFGWDVSIVSKYRVDKGFQKWQQVGPSQQVEDGKPFYNLIYAEYLPDYIQENEKYKLTGESDVEVADISTETSSESTQKEVPEIKDRSQVKKEKQKKYRMHLMRDEEKPIKS